MHDDREHPPLAASHAGAPLDTEAVAFATARLTGVDEAFVPIVALAGPCPLGTPARRTSHFASLASAICHQQLAGAAARTIHRRFVTALGGAPTPLRVLEAGEPVLRAAGLSAAKVAAVTDLARQCEDGELVLRTIGRRSDAEVVEALVAVRGIGRWTAEMFLLFQLRRPDVWPTGDLGVQLGWAALHGGDRPTPVELAAAAEPLTGVRSVAAWYCWRAIEATRDGSLGEVSSPARGVR